MGAQRMKNIPGIKPAFVPIGKNGLDRVIADRFDADDINIPFADLESLLTLSVSTCFSRRRIDAKKLVGELIAFSVSESHFENSGFLMQLDFGRDWRFRFKAGHDSLRG